MSPTFPTLDAPQTAALTTLLTSTLSSLDESTLTDALDYTKAMVENCKSVAYVVDELLGMGFIEESDKSSVTATLEQFIADPNADPNASTTAASEAPQAVKQSPMDTPLAAGRGDSVTKQAFDKLTKKRGLAEVEGDHKVGGGKGVCYAWRKGECSREECRFDHFESEGGENQPAKKVGGGRGECYAWKKGECTRGAECRFEHGSGGQQQQGQQQGQVVREANARAT